MVSVAQLVEHPVVVRDVAGSSPVAHPIIFVIRLICVTAYLCYGLEVVVHPALFKTRAIASFSGLVTQSPYLTFT